MLGQHNDIILICKSLTGPLYQRSLVLARALGCPLHHDLEENSVDSHNYAWQFTLSEQHLSLSSPKQNIGPVWVDFVKGKAGYRLMHGGSNQAIVKACGIRGGQKPIIFDATAGFGYDSFVLASMGAKVIAVEQSPIVYELLQDGLIRAKLDDKTQVIADRITIYQGNALDYLGHYFADVIYLDPMFEHSNKKSALSNKNMQALSQLLCNDPINNDQLLINSLEIVPKVVVKRARRSPFLANLKPHHQLLGKANRFDVYLGTPLSSRIKMENG